MCRPAQRPRCIELASTQAIDNKLFYLFNGASGQVFFDKGRSYVLSGSTALLNKQKTPLFGWRFLLDPIKMVLRCGCSVLATTSQIHFQRRKVSLRSIFSFKCSFIIYQTCSFCQYNHCSLNCALSSAPQRNLSVTLLTKLVNCQFLPILFSFILFIFYIFFILLSIRERIETLSDVNNYSFCPVAERRTPPPN